MHICIHFKEEKKLSNTFNKYSENFTKIIEYLIELWPLPLKHFSCFEWCLSAKNKTIRSISMRKSILWPFKTWKMLQRQGSLLYQILDYFREIFRISAKCVVQLFLFFEMYSNMHCLLFSVGKLQNHHFKANNQGP